MDADAFEAGLFGVNEFLWHCETAGLNTRVSLDNRFATDAGRLSRDIRALLAHLRMVEADRDRWQVLALKLSEHFEAPK